MFVFGQNQTDTGQTFYDEYRNPISVPPKYAVDLSLLDGCWGSVLRPIHNFLEECVDSRIVVQRTFSLGDTLMLVPVLRELKRLGYEVIYQANEKYRELLRLLEVKTRPINTLGDPTILLDGVVERDHREPALQKLHRVETFAHAVGLRELPKTWDWNCALSKFPELADPWSDEPYVVFQGCGAGKQRGLLQDTVQFVLDALMAEGIRTLYIGEPMGLEVLDPKFTKLQFVNSKLPEVVSWIAKARCVISMDSSPLWISHFTKTPVVLILGPSRKEQRVSLHPLYPEGVATIELNKEVHCASCFEVAKKCGYKYNCLHGVTGERLYELIRPHVKRYYEVET